MSLRSEIKRVTGIDIVPEHLVTQVVDLARELLNEEPWMRGSFVGTVTLAARVAIELIAAELRAEPSPVFASAIAYADELRMRDYELRPYYTRLARSNDDCPTRGQRRAAGRRRRDCRKLRDFALV